MTSLKGLYDTDDLAGADFSVVSPMTSAEATPVKKQLARRRSSSGKKSDKHAFASSWSRYNKTPKKI